MEEALKLSSEDASSSSADIALVGKVSDDLKKEADLDNVEEILVTSDNSQDNVCSDTEVIKPSRTKRKFNSIESDDEFESSKPAEAEEASVPSTKMNRELSSKKSKGGEQWVVSK